MVGSPTASKAARRESSLTIPRSRILESSWAAIWLRTSISLVKLKGSTCSGESLSLILPTAALSKARFSAPSTGTTS